MEVTSSGSELPSGLMRNNPALLTSCTGCVVYCQICGCTSCISARIIAESDLELGFDTADPKYLMEILCDGKKMSWNRAPWARESELAPQYMVQLSVHDKTSSFQAHLKMERLDMSW
jgi:hypothetical protein